MKLKITTLFLLLVSTYVSAKTAVTVDINSSSHVSFAERVTYEHSIKCYWKKRGDDHNSLGSRTVTGSSINGTYTNNVNLTSRHHATSPFPATPRNLNIQISMNKNGEQETVSAKVIDRINTGAMKYTIDGSGCKRAYGSAVAKKHMIHGSIIFKYTVPQNIYLLKINRSSFSSLFASSRSTSFNDAINGDEDQDLSREVYLWVQPGQTIQQSFDISHFVSQNRDWGSYQITFTPIGKHYKDSKKLQESISSILKFIRNIGRQEALSQDTLKAFIETSWSLSRTLQIDQNSDLMKSINTNLAKKLNDSLYKYANMDVRGGKLGNISKMVAAIAGYEVAGSLLAGFMPYCKNLEINLPFQATQRTVLGLKAAYFWAHRAKNTLQYQSYDDIERFIKDLVINESNNRSYMDVMNDPEERRRLRVSEKRISNFSGVFRAASSDINKILDSFGDFGASTGNAKEILATLKELTQQENRFKRSYFNHLNKYTYTNSDKVEAISLLNALNDLKYKRDELVDRMNYAINFLNYTNNPTVHSFMAELSSFVLHQMNLITGELKDPVLEKVRTIYIEDRNLLQLTNQAEQCIQGNN